MKNSVLVLCFIIIGFFEFSCQTISHDEKQQLPVKVNSPKNKKLLLSNEKQFSGSYDKETKKYKTTFESFHKNKFELNDSMTILIRTANPPLGGEYVYTWILKNKKLINGQYIFEANCREESDEDFHLIIDSNYKYIKILSEAKFNNGIFEEGFFMQFEISKSWSE